MPTCPKWNNKGKPAGSGTVTQGRREAFKKKALARELKHMGEEDVQVPWERVMALKARLLTPEEVQEYLKPKPKPEPEPEEALDQRASASLDERGSALTGRQAKAKAHTLDQRVGAQAKAKALDKRVGRPKEKARPKAQGAQKESKASPFDKKGEAEEKEQSQALDQRVLAPSEKQLAQEEEGGGWRKVGHSRYNKKAFLEEVEPVSDVDWGGSSSSSSSQSKPKKARLAFRQVLDRLEETRALAKRALHKGDQMDPCQKGLGQGGGAERGPC